jgi:hypothetical protein
MLNHEEIDEPGPEEVAWPLEKRGGAAFAAEKLASASAARLLSADEMRALGMRLMRLGPPMGWMGALMVLESNRRSARSG